MKMVIYLDVLLGVNLLIAWCLLRATGGLTSSPIHVLRLCLASIVAALSTLALLAPTMPAILQILTKLGGSICIVSIAFPYTGPRLLIKQSLWYFLLNLILAGVVLLASFFNKNTVMETNNLVVYFNISPQVLIFSVLSIWLLLKLAEMLFTVPFSDIPVEMQLEFSGKQIKLQAMADTGCHLKDPLTGQKVVLISLPAAIEQLPPRITNATTQYFSGVIPNTESGIRLISCSTASGKTVLPAFSAQRIVLRRGQQTIKCPVVTVAITKEEFQPGNQPALVGADWLEQMI